MERRMEEQITYYHRQIETVMQQVNQVIIGKEDCVRKVMAAILAGGHILMDDIPGVGKTTLAMAFSDAMSLESGRIQFTPDVMPSDILGFSMYQKQTGQFEYQPGAVMCNLFLGDEINRTSPKTQSALLEVMEEGRVTIDGVTRDVPDPFIVIATENPAGSVGTQLLPESQLDRFMICLSMGYPSLQEEIAIVKARQEGSPAPKAQSVMDARELLQVRRIVEKTYVRDAIYHYACELTQGSRDHMHIDLGISPRGTLSLIGMAKAMAFLHRRNYVVPEDVEEVFLDVASHRIIRSAKARAERLSSEKILRGLLKQIKKPTAVRE